MRKLLDVSAELMLERNMVSMLSSIARHAASLMEADRASLFLVDRAAGELWTMVAMGSQEIRVPLTHGVVGRVACTGETVNVANAYELPGFDISVDQQTGNRPGSLMATPVFGSDGQVCAVAQVINKVCIPCLPHYVSPV
jgi:adenylate cyclase